MLQNIIQISIGAALVVATVVALLVNIAKTPNNLREFYGKMFLILMILGVIGGVTLITFGVMGLLA